MFRLTVLLAVVVSVRPQTTTPPTCPSGFVNNAALGCILPPADHATFDAALTRCQSFGARLPIVHDAATHQALVAFIRSQNPQYFHWVGLRRLTGQTFEWIDQTAVDFTAWQSGRPSNFPGFDCVSLFAGSTDVGWRDAMCTDSLPFVCVFTPPPPSTPDPNAPCPGDTYTDSGYIQSPHYPSQYQNNADCQYHITVATGQYVLLTVERFQTESCCDFLYLYNGPTTNSPLLIRLSGVLSPNQQYEANSNVMTARFTSDSSVTDIGFRIQYNSTSVAPTTTPPPTTPTQFPPTSPSPQCGIDFIFDPISTLCFHWQYSLFTFQQATAECANRQSTLAAIHSDRVQTFLISYLLNSTVNMDRWVSFIGLNTAVNGTFTTWTDGSAIDYTAWITGEPNTGNGGCAVIQPYAPIGWRTWNCNTARPFLCMKASMKR